MLIVQPEVEALSRKRSRKSLAFLFDHYTRHSKEHSFRLHSLFQNAFCRSRCRISEESTHSKNIYFRELNKNIVHMLRCALYLVLMRFLSFF